MWTTLRKTDGDRPWLMPTGMPSAKQFTKRIEGSEWEELRFHYREMSKAAGAKKPSESQNAKALWATKAAMTGGRNSMIQLAKKTFLGRKQTRLELWEEHLKDPIIALDKALKCLANPCQG